MKTLLYTLLIAILLVPKTVFYIVLNAFLCVLILAKLCLFAPEDFNRKLRDILKSINYY